MIETLHHYRTIAENHRTSIDKRLTGYTVMIGVTNDATYLVINEFQAANTIAGTYPDIMVLILLDTVNDIVEKSVMTGYQFGKMC